jgi:hypothetical protein
MHKIFLQSMVAGLLSAAALSAAQAPQLDAGTWLARQDTQLGPRAGTITLHRAGELTHDVTLSVGHDLVIAAPLRIAATIHLLGNNHIRCRAPLEAQQPRNLFQAESATGISITGCDVTQTGPAGGYLLAVKASSHISVAHNHLLNLNLFTTQDDTGHTTDLAIADNVVRFPANNGFIGIYLIRTLRATVIGNALEGLGHGVEWWGGDANGGWRGPQSVVDAGELTIQGNHCRTIAGACIWGSMGYNVNVTGNSDKGCGDVCFDVEGGVNNVFTHNQASNCGFGCYAAEFESLGTVFRENEATTTAGHNLVLIKHGPQNPYNHTNLHIEDNVLTCPQLCVALYTEGDDGLFFTGNTITNASIASVNYHHDFTVTGNTFVFTVDPGSSAAIAGPALFQHHTSLIANNSLTDRAPADPATICIAQSWSDFNDADTMTITGNSCSGFTRGLVTATGGANPGAPRAIWTISGNHVNGAAAGKAYQHARMAGNETYTFTPENTVNGNPLRP